MEWKNKGIFFSVWVLLFVLLTGCRLLGLGPNPPKEPKDPYLGYVYTLSIQDDTDFKQDTVGSMLKEYKEQIASKVFERRQKQHHIYADSLVEMNEYIAHLKQSVPIEEGRWKGAIDDSLNKKEKQKVLAYWEANKPLSFDGSESLDDWRKALSNAKALLGTNTRKAEKIESDIDDLRKGKSFRKALDKVGSDLRKYKPERVDGLVESLKKEASEYWVAKRRSEIGELKRAKVYDGDHEQRVLDLYSNICDDVKVFGNPEGFKEAFTPCMDLLGENLRKRIATMGGSKKYWEAYEFAKEKYFDYVDTLRYDKSYRKGVKVKIGKGYFEILDKALRHYSDLASNACKLKRLDGKAYVYCCMAKEMYDFATFADLGSNDKMETWYKRISELEKNELMPALDSRVARRLVIHDFDRDKWGLSKDVRESCLKKYALGNNHARSLEVVTDKVALAQLEDGSLPVKPNDYVVKWSLADVKVKGKQGHPNQKFVFVKTDRIKLVDNPFRKDKSSKFHKLKKVKSQEVDQYLLIEVVKGIELSCNMDVLCRHRGREKPIILRETKKKIEKINEQFNEVTSVTATCSYPNYPPKTKYYPPDQYNNTIPKDEIPKNDVIKLEEDEWFEKALIGVITKDLDDGLEGLIDMYPVELLAGTDHDASSEYLDTLGTVLFYVVNLSATEAAKRDSAGKGYEWLHLSEQVAENMTEWCGRGERWSAAGADEKKILSSLWEECIKVGKEQDGR